MLRPVLKTIPTHQLRLGMFLHQLTGSWMSHPFWRSRFMLRDARDITKLLEAGIQEVVIDTDQGLDVAPEPVAEAEVPVIAVAANPAAVDEPTPALPPAHPAVASAGPQYTEALDVSRRSLGAVIELFQQARMGQALDSKTCLPVVEDVMSSVNASPSALISIARLKTVDDYTYMHAVAVCALMVGLARQMGLPDALVREAGLAGLLLDTGKAAMPPELLGKAARVSDEEMALLKTHARLGHEMLLKEGGFSAAVLDACLHHHERMDGSGYPDGLAGDKIAPLARMAAICDVYDAVTSRRPYRAPWDPGEAMRHMAQAKGQFDPQIFQHFVKAVGIYPVGSLVRLQSDRLAVIVAQGTESLLKPRVKVFYTAEEQHRLSPPFELDLADPNAADKIVGVEPPASWRFQDLEQLWLED
jgi:HD-GYP domain-containing protein (c-di-GMP phosphodiesterase class II)